MPRTGGMSPTGSLQPRRTEVAAGRRRHILQLARGWLAYGLGPLLGLASAPLLARALGVEGRGTLAAILQPLSIADQLAALGIPAAVTFYVARGHAPREVMASARRLVLAFGFVVTAGLLLYAIHLHRTGRLALAETLPFWLSVVWVGAIVSIRRASLQGLGRYGAMNAERVTSPLLRVLAIACLFALAIRPPSTYAAAYLGAGILAWAWLYRPAETHAIRAPKQSDSSHSGSPVSPRALLGFGTLAGVTGFSTALGARLDQALLPALAGLEVLGIYSVAVTVAEVPLIVTAVAARNILTEAGRADIHAMRRTFKVGAVFLAGSCILETLAVPWLLPTVFGEEYRAAVPVVLVLLVGTFFGGVLTMLTAVLIGGGKPGRAAVGAAVAAAVTVVGLMALGQQATAVTVALVSIMAQGLALLASAVVYGRARLHQTQ